MHREQRRMPWILDPIWKSYTDNDLCLLDIRGYLQWRFHEVDLMYQIRRSIQCDNLPPLSFTVTHFPCRLMAFDGYHYLHAIVMPFWSHLTNGWRPTGFAVTTLCYLATLLRGGIPGQFPKQEAIWTHSDSFPTVNTSENGSCFKTTAKFPYKESLQMRKFNFPPRNQHYAPIHTYVHVRMRIHTYVHVRMRIHTYVHVRMHIHTYVHVRMRIHTYVHVCMRPYIHMYMYVCAYIHMYMYVCAHTYICTCMYAHTCMYVHRWSWDGY